MLNAYDSPEVQQVIHYRPVRADDAAQLARIQNHYIVHTNACFYYAPLTCEQLAEKIASVAPVHPFIVAEDDGEVIAFAYGAPMHPHDAYRWSCELTVYVDCHRLHEGIGSGLYRRMLALMRRMGYLHAYACITADNKASIAMHERFGFRHVGLYPAIGYKAGAWHDVAWLALTLTDALPDAPVPPGSFGDMESDELNAILA